MQTFKRLSHSLCACKYRLPLIFPNTHAMPVPLNYTLPILLDRCSTTFIYPNSASQSRFLDHTQPGHQRRSTPDAASTGHQPDTLSDQRDKRSDQPTAQVAVFPIGSLPNKTGHFPMYKVETPCGDQWH